MKKMAGTLKVPRRKLVMPRIAPAAARRPEPQATMAGSHVSLGRIVAWDERGPSVDFEGNTRGPVRARLTAPLPGQQRPAPRVLEQEVVLLIDSRPARPPVILGFLTPLDGTTASPADAGALEARVDGKRVEIEGQDEIVLRCGKASIVLRRNGRIALRGVDVETKAAGVNRIKGGSVQIN